MILDLFPPSEVESSSIVFMANHLGESLENDQSSRAKAIAEDLAAMVIAYERPGTGSESTIFNLGLEHRFQPDSYATIAAYTGRLLELAVPQPMKDLPRLLYGNSAGGSDAVAVTLAETVKVDYLAVGAPVGMQKMGRLEYGLRWLKQEYTKDKSPAAEAPTEESSELAITKKEMIVRALPEIIRYSELWRSASTFYNLRDIAEKPEFGHIAVNVAIPRQNFTPFPKFAEGSTRALREYAPADRPSPFRAYTIPELHSFFNDPKNRADFIAQTLALGLAS